MTHPSPQQSPDVVDGADGARSTAACRAVYQNRQGLRGLSVPDQPHHVQQWPDQWWHAVVWPRRVVELTHCPLLCKQPTAQLFTINYYVCVDYQTALFNTKTTGTNFPTYIIILTTPKQLAQIILKKHLVYTQKTLYSGCRVRFILKFNQATIRKLYIFQILNC